MGTTATLTPESTAAEHARLLARANEQNAKYPQYQGYYDGWVVATATRRIVQRGQVTLEKGDRCLLDPTSFHKGGEMSRYPDAVFCTVYLSEYLSNGCNVSRRATDFTVAG